MVKGVISEMDVPSDDNMYHGIDRKLTSLWMEVVEDLLGDPIFMTMIRDALPEAMTSPLRLRSWKRETIKRGESQS